MAVLRRAYIGASCAWAAALPLATFATSRPHGACLHVLVLAIYAIGSIVCHQLPERSFHLWGHQMPVCARCTGIYAGAAMAAAVLVVARRLRASGASAFARSASADRRSLGGGWSASLAVARVLPTRAEAGPVPTRVRVILAAALLPTIATLVYEWSTGAAPSNTVRALAGWPLGAAVSWIVIR